VGGFFYFCRARGVRIGLFQACILMFRFPVGLIGLRPSLGCGLTPICAGTVAFLPVFTAVLLGWPGFCFVRPSPMRLS